MVSCVFFFQAEDGIRYLVRSRGLGDVYKRQTTTFGREHAVTAVPCPFPTLAAPSCAHAHPPPETCLLYTSDAADERSSVDLGGRRIIKKNKIDTQQVSTIL